MFLRNILGVLLIFQVITGTRQQQQSGEVFLGNLPNLDHGVSGQVYALNDNTLVIRNLNYDGQAPDAYFWVGTSKKPNNLGTAIPDENGSLAPIKGYRNANITLHLPKNKSLKNIKYFGLWCRAFQINFGHVTINQ